MVHRVNVAVWAQIKDGSMWNKMAAPHKPPPRYMGGSAVAALPDMATVHLNRAQVDAAEKEDSTKEESTNDLVKGLDSAVHGADQVCAYLTQCIYQLGLKGQLPHKTVDFIF